MTPEVHFLGNFKENWIVVMSKQGPSILELMKKGAFSVTLESISLLAIKVVVFFVKFGTILRVIYFVCFCSNIYRDNTNIRQTRIFGTSLWLSRV